MENNNNNETDVAISFCIEEMEKEIHQKLNISELMDEIENTKLNNDLIMSQVLNYHENFTVKELLMICEYYGFAKELKSNKANKEQIIHFLVMFENDPTNFDIVFKRQNMWFYMNELKNDKFMKKYVIW